MKVFLKQFGILGLLMTSPLRAESVAHLGDAQVCVQDGSEAEHLALARRIKETFEQISSVRWLISEPVGSIVPPGCEFTGMGCPQSYATFSVAYDQEVISDRITLATQVLKVLDSTTSCGSFKVEL